MAGTNSERELLAEGPAIILVEPQLGENIGMVARAMANFGLAELRLVNPRDGWPSEKAQAAASQGRSRHRRRQGLSRRWSRRSPTSISSMRRRRANAMASSRCVPRWSPPKRCGRNSARARSTGILFGRERWGLTNEEVALADEIVTFPVNPAFASLNIAQAVLLMSYEWMKSGMEDHRYRAVPGDVADAIDEGAAARPFRPVWKRR